MQHVRLVPKRNAFTLVEMLVVIAIIGVLVALLSTTIASAIRKTKNTAMSVEIQDMARALDAYKAFAGTDFPPDFTNNQAVVNHITRAFPRNTRNVNTWLSSNPTLDPAEALVVWLSLLSTNPRDPLSGADASYTGERKVFFTFDTGRLVDLDNDGWQEYVPEHGIERPYVYFDGRLIGGSYAYATAVYPKQSAAQPAPVTSGEVVRPYRSNTNVNTARDANRTQPYNVPTGQNMTEWLQPGGFQIICAGADNAYGPDFVLNNAVVFKTFPTPNYAVIGPEEDTITSFSEGKTLLDAVP